MNYDTKYRPSQLADIVGHDETVACLTRLFEESELQPGSFLFCGPSGVGKTTLARIVAERWGASGDNILEVDAASNSGVGDVRELVQSSRYKGIAAKGRRAIILDEAHRLSAQAWDVLLKPIEEPPPHLLWILCTTEKAKVPKTIQTRCSSFFLGAVPEAELKELLLRVMREESIKLPARVGKLLLSRSEGSPRLLLTLLGQVAGLEEGEALALLDGHQASSAEMIELCRLIAKGGKFKSAAKMVKDLGLDKGGAPGARRMILGYFTAIALKGTNPGRALEVISAFEMPYPSEDHTSSHHLLLSLAQVCEF